ncbi:MAG TPA: hypothetical protein PLZ51_25020, partial [Aggregatilineales bacterium]|nr:hypothetical protein [Aggregatilineales bacterium]
MTVSIMKIGTAIAVAGPGLMAAGLAVSNIGFAIKTVAPFMGLLTSPLGLIAGAGLVLAKVFNVDLKKAFEDTVAVVMPALQGLYTWFVEEALPDIVDFVETTVIPIFESIGDTIQDVWNF